ncbi:CBS domain-containing protein [bacterium]|nr:CBS domain-containing protein [bacterium]
MASELLVADLMDKKFNTVKESDTINKVIRTLMKKGLIGLLVVDDEGNLVGRLSEKECLDVFVHQTYHALPAGKVKDHMSKIEFTVPSTMTAKEVADVFLENNIRRLPVVDSEKLVGQITRRDLVRGLHLHFFPQGVTK